MGAETLTEERECAWPARFGAWASRAPSTRTLCRSRRAVGWRIRPPSVEDLTAVVAEAARARTPLWPVSRGCNWGYGSHLPARSGSIIVDLSGLRAIGGLDRASQSVRIEPGVTQGMLRDYLLKNAPDLAFNVTGAGVDTSVLGNALERGIGYAGEKDQDLYALEVLLPDGSRLGPVPGHHHPSRTHPAGLSTDALFFQTNFGIVVAARLRLRIRQEAEDAGILQGHLEPLIATLKSAYDAGLVSGPTHVAEPGRSGRLGAGLLRLLWKREPTPEEVSRCFPERDTYNALLPLHGRRRVVDAAWRELRALAVPGIIAKRAGSSKLETAARWLGRLGARFPSARLRALRPILALTWGEPTDAGLASLDGFGGGDPDLAARGAIYGNAVSTVGFEEAERASEIVSRHWPDSAFTWIILDSRCMLTIYTLHFDDGASAAAHAADAAIVSELRSIGFPPYRLGIDGRAAPGADALARRLKALFDPEGIIAPGRYES